MEKMHAAVVTSFDEPPHYLPFDVPQLVHPNESLVDVLAVGLHPRTRSGAAGAHYTSSGTLPMIPGVDGVARRGDGTLVYFAADDGVIGTMADKTLVDARRLVELPGGVDVASVAATMNPAMSSWVALRRRVPITPGQSVLVLGATGNAGSMAVPVAKRLGAGHVIGAGRDPQRLAALDADKKVGLAGHDLAVAADVDVVLDYLWGRPSQEAIMAMLTRRADRSRPLDWIQIGSVAGPTIELPSVALRSANFQLLGSGQGSVSPRDYVAELPSLVEEIAAGRLVVPAVTRPLADVERVWTEPETPGVRTVLVP